MAIIQFLNMRGLWTDESAVAINIVKRDYEGLLKPLDHLQVAPILYLWVVKFMSQVFSEQEWGLRLYSLISYFLSLWLFCRLLQRFVKNQTAILVGLVFFIFNNKLFYYADEVKQYMSDVMVALALVSLALDWRDDDRRSIIGLSLAGLIGVFLSNISVMILPTVFLICLFQGGNPWNQRRITSMILMSIPWLVGFLFNYFLFIHGHPSRDQQVSLWQDFFPPTDLFSRQIIFFVFNTAELIKRDFGLGMNNLQHSSERFEYIHFAVFIFLMMVYLHRVYRDRGTLWVLIIPMSFHFILSYLHLYPLAPRTMLYTYPFIAIILALGAESILKGLQNWGVAIKIITLASVVMIAIMFIRAYIPRTLEESRPVLSYMQAHGKPGMVTYSYAAGNSMLDYYVNVGIYKSSGPVYYAAARGDDPQIHVNEILQVNKEAWLYLAHFKMKQKSGILKGLELKGYSFPDSVKAKGVEAFHIVPPAQ
jgi:membrane protein implicated in regulation of membrane protease activity